MSNSIVEAVPFAVYAQDGSDNMAMRPVDAATIILVDRRNENPRFLMGRRSGGHAFMPDLYVFPGGRRDPRDHARPFSQDLHPLVIKRLLSAVPARMTIAGARALALAAMRELKEETGLSATDGHDRADLSHLRYVARAVTPPGNVRRYDTRFFLLPVDDAGISSGAAMDSDELQDLRWVGQQDLANLTVPKITLAILDDVTTLLEADPSLPYGMSVPFYFMQRGQFVRTRI